MKTCIYALFATGWRRTYNFFWIFTLLLFLSDCCASPAMVRARGSRRSTSTFSSTPSSWYPQSSLALVPSQERVFPLRYRVSQPNSDKTDAEGVGRRRLCCAFSSGSIATEFTPTISASLLGQQRFLTEKNCGKSGKV